MHTDRVGALPARPPRRPAQGRASPATRQKSAARRISGCPRIRGPTSPRRPPSRKKASAPPGQAGEGAVSRRRAGAMDALYQVVNARSGASTPRRRFRRTARTRVDFRHLTGIWKDMRASLSGRRVARGFCSGWPRRSWPSRASRTVPRGRRRADPLLRQRGRGQRRRDARGPGDDSGSRGHGGDPPRDLSGLPERSTARPSAARSRCRSR